MPTMLIAPCGMNCRLCRAYGRKHKPCPGCRGSDSFKSKSCIACAIRNCPTFGKVRIEYCFGCESYPCSRLIRLDARYRARYGMSMIENLDSIEKFGIRNFVIKETEKWACPRCGEILCVHKENCPSCGCRRR